MGNTKTVTSTPSDIERKRINRKAARRKRKLSAGRRKRAATNAAHVLSDGDSTSDPGKSAERVQTATSADSASGAEGKTENLSEPALPAMSVAIRLSSCLQWLSSLDA